MQDTSAACAHAIRREADSLQATRDHGRFRRRRDPEHAPDDRDMVLAAVARARVADPDAMRFLYLRHADQVFSYVCSIVNDEHAAEDITQTIFACLEKRLQRYEPRVVPFAAWITRVAHNAAIDHLRAQRLVPCEEVRSPAVAAEDVSRDRLESLREALSMLPDDQREVLTLRFVIGMSPGEIAERLGRTENAIHALQHRARRRLCVELERLGAAPAARALA